MPKFLRLKIIHHPNLSTTPIKSLRNPRYLKLIDLLSIKQHIDLIKNKHNLCLTVKLPVHVLKDVSNLRVTLRLSRVNHKHDDVGGRVVVVPSTDSSPSDLEDNEPHTLVNHKRIYSELLLAGRLRKTLQLAYYCRFARTG